MMYGIMDNQIREVFKLDKCTMTYVVQVVAIISLTALAVAAMVIGGSVGDAIVVAVAAGIGGMVGYVFPSPLQSKGDDAE